MFPTHRKPIYLSCLIGRKDISKPASRISGTYLGGIGAQTETGNTVLIKIEPGVEAGFEQPLVSFLIYRRLRLPKRGLPIASRRFQHPGWVLLGEDRVTRRADEK